MSKNPPAKTLGAQTPGYDPDQRIAYRFSVLSTLQTRCLAGMYTKKYSLSVNGWWVMCVIGRFAPTSATNVVDHTTLEPDKVTRTVDTLVKHGFVLRRQDMDDRRRVVLSLTAKGKRAFQEIEEVRSAIECQLLSALDEKELGLFYKMLDKLEARGTEIFTGNQAWKALVEEHSPAAEEDTSVPETGLRRAGAKAKGR